MGKKLMTLSVMADAFFWAGRTELLCVLSSVRPAANGPGEPFR